MYFQQLNQWVRYQGNPVLTASSNSSSFYSGTVSDPKVFQRPDGTYGMAFRGCDQSGVCAIGLATSTNARNWVVNSNPILKKAGGSTSLSGSGGNPWDNNVFRPGSIFYDSSQGKYLLYYSALNNTWNGVGPTELVSGIGLATSNDGVTFTREQRRAGRVRQTALHFRRLSAGAISIGSQVRKYIHDVAQR